MRSYLDGSGYLRIDTKGWVERPTKVKASFELTPLGLEACIRLFREYFGKANSLARGAQLAGTLLDLPMDLDALVYFRLSTFEEPQYVDAATGMPIFEGDGNAEFDALSEEEHEMNPRYLRIPKQTNEEYLTEIKAYAAIVREPAKKAALQAALEQEPDPSNLAELRLLLRDDRQWAEWHRGQARRYMRQWLASHSVV